MNFSNGKLRFIISPYGDNVSGFFDVKTKNIDIEVNTILSGLKIQNLEILKFKSPFQDFSLTMKKKILLKLTFRVIL